METQSERCKKNERVRDRETDRDRHPQRKRKKETQRETEAHHLLPGFSSQIMFSYKLISTLIF